MPDYLRMDLGDLVRHLSGKGSVAARREAPPAVWVQEANSQDARLRVVPGEKSVEFFSLITGQRLFSLPSAITGPPVTSTESADRGHRQVVVTVPLEGGKTVRVTYQCPPEVEPSGVETTRASHARVPPESSMVEFLLTRDEHEFRYMFEFPEELPVHGFEAVDDRRPVFRTTPPVAQMAAFLRAMTQHRRSTMTCLEDIARQAGTEATRAQVASLPFGRGHEFASPRLQALEETLKRSGRIIHPAVLAAMAIFVELEWGSLQLEPFEVSARACWHVARHFNVDPSPTLWLEQFAESPDYAEDEALRQAMKRSATARTHLDILSDLGREAKSQRVAAFVEAMRPRLEGGQFQVNDEQVALGGLLAASGTPVHGNTLTALCLFVDVEVGVLTPLAYDKLVVAGDRVDTSMYAMVAVAGAFDLGLRGFAQEQASESALKSLLQLAGGQLMARFLKPGQDGFWWEYLSAAEDVRKVVAEGLGFTGHVLGKFALIDQLGERDLNVFLRAGKPMMACFSADYDRTILWKKLVPEDVADHYTFIRGYTAYSFNRMVMAELASGRPKEPAVVGELDQRGNYQFRYLEDPGELPEGWLGKRVAFPIVDELPDLMYELGQDPLLGRSGKLEEEAHTLQLIHASVGRILKSRPSYLALDEHPEMLDKIQAVARELSVPVIDPGTKDGLLELIKRPGYAEVSLFEPLASAVESSETLELLTLQLLFALCTAHDIELERRFKQYDETRFRQLLRSRLHALLSASAPGIRALAVRLLATSEEIGDRNDRLIAQYELSRARHDEQAEVREAAGEALAQLAMEGAVPLPEMVRVVRHAPRAEAAPSSAPEETNQDVLKMAAEIREWLAAVPAGDKREELARGVTPEQVSELAEFLVGLNRAVMPDQHIYVLLLEAERLRPLQGAVFDSWKVFALSQGHRLSELVKQKNALELRLEYQDFLVEHGAELARKFADEAPFLGGSTGPVRLFHLNPREPFGPWRRKDSSFVEASREDSPLFLALLPSLEELPRVLKVDRAGGQALVDLESHLASFTTERLIEPWQAEVFQPTRNRFAPFLQRMGLDRRQLAHEEDFEDFEALLELLHGDALDPVEEAADEEPAGPSFKDLVQSLSQSFDLPRSHHKQVINILLDVGVQSVYDL